MPFDFKWYDDDHTIVWLDAHGEKTWRQYHEAIDQFAEDLKQTERRLDLVIDDKGGMPPGNPLPHIKVSAQKLVPFPNMGLITVASDRRTLSVLNTLVKAVYRAYGIDTRIIGGFANSLEEAVEIIENDRAKETHTT